MTKVDELLDDRMESAGDYPDWWEPEDVGDQLEGLVVQKRDDPWAEEDDDNPASILHVRRANGTERSTRTHVVLQRLIDKFDVQVGDYVRIEYDGANRTDDGHMANDYQMGVVKRHELEKLPDSALPENLRTSEGEISTETDETPDSDDSDSEQEESSTEEQETSDDAENPESEPLFDPSELTVSEIEERVGEIDDDDMIERLNILEAAADDRATAHDVFDKRLSELQRNDSEFDEEVLSFAENIVEFNEDDIDLDELDQYLNTVRGFEVDPEAVATELGYEIESDGTVVA